MECVTLFIKSDFNLGIFLFSSFLSFFVETEVKSHLNADFISGFIENSYLNFVLFYQKIINKKFPEFSSLSLYRIEYPVTPNPIMYMINEISYL